MLECDVGRGVICLLVCGVGAGAGQLEEDPAGVLFELSGALRLAGEELFHSACDEY